MLITLQDPGYVPTLPDEADLTEYPVPRLHMSAVYTGTVCRCLGPQPLINHNMGPNP